MKCLCFSLHDIAVENATPDDVIWLLHKSGCIVSNKVLTGNTMRCDVTDEATVMKWVAKRDWYSFFKLAGMVARNECLDALTNVLGELGIASKKASEALAAFTTAADDTVENRAQGRPVRPRLKGPWND